MAAYSNSEYADIFYCYAFCDGNAAKARREYIRRYPQRRAPHVTVFSAIYRRASETGQFQRRQSNGGRPRRYTAQDEEVVIQQVVDDPTISTHIIAARLGMSQYKVWSIVHGTGLYPYHYTPGQVLEEGDPVRRLEYCRFILNTDAEDPSFLRRILWTDESKFDQDGITNYHNIHYWSQKSLRNPGKVKPTGSQRHFSLNVWMGVINNHLIGLHFLLNNLNGKNYEKFLRNELGPLLEDVELETRRRMVFQHDGCPAHYRITVQQWLDTSFPRR